jgi:hypothetical protein
MRVESYVAALRQRRAQLEEDRAAITERSMRLRSRWGTSGPFSDTTNGWLGELNRRISELTAIIKAFERNYAV